VARDDWKLYIGEQQYGSLGYAADHAWETLQGRFAMAFLFEYVATMGLLDVAYISPVSARNDFRERWGTDDISCLSRYDGLMFVRINPLGAWGLGLANTYEPKATAVERVLRVLPNLDVVAADRRPTAADVRRRDGANSGLMPLQRNSPQRTRKKGARPHCFSLRSRDRGAIKRFGDTLYLLSGFPLSPFAG